MIMTMSGSMIEIEGSGKHCHVTRETLDILFGKGFELEAKKMLIEENAAKLKNEIQYRGTSVVIFKRECLEALIKRRV